MADLYAFDKGRGGWGSDFLAFRRACGENLRERRWFAGVDTVSSRYTVCGLVSLTFRQEAAVFSLLFCAQMVSLSAPVLYILLLRS